MDKIAGVGNTDGSDHMRELAVPNATGTTRPVLFPNWSCELKRVESKNY